MNNAIVSSNVLSLWFEAGDLETNNKFQLNCERSLNLGPIVITTFEIECSTTLFCHGLTRAGLDLLEALGSGMLELVESGKENVIVLRPATSPQLGQLNISPKPSSQHRQVSVNVYTDTSHAAWKEILQPGHTYGLRFSENHGKMFAYYTDDIDDQVENLPPAKKLAVGLEGGTHYFTVHDDPAPPRIFARLEMPRQAHLTGPIPFTSIIEYTTDSREPLVIDKSRYPLPVFSEDLKSLDSLIHCQDIDTRDKVPWCGAFGCWDSDPHPDFPDDDDFIEISADKPRRFKCTLKNQENEDEYVRSMEGLEAGHTYKARVAGRALVAFNRWQYEKKAELLAEAREEKMRRWEVDMDNLGSLRVERVEKEVVFEAVA